MALARIRTVEQLRYSATGEWGALLGLDRIPEVRTLREKVNVLAQPGAVGQWSGLLSREWMEGAPDAAGVLYVDGHVRVYHGSQTALPRRYVSRERLCLRGTTEYWVNDRQGRPFFVVSTPFTDGLLVQLRDVIVPRLLGEVPHQPSDAALEADPYLSRFTLVFDREGYSPAFFARSSALPARPITNTPRSLGRSTSSPRARSRCPPAKRSVWPWPNADQCISWPPVTLMAWPVM
ncbi:MAG: hypothetical protein NTU83_01490 [Candidatus Hydrogenedentes bacterium]|nr:hypothetical protein [Candidatus Hydrogenedentota bacterium]